MNTGNLTDKFLNQVDSALRTLLPPTKRTTKRQVSGLKPNHTIILNSKEQAHVAGLMRVNHAGEVCAQALYQGQALTAKLTDVKDQMSTAAAEEIDHLAWCEQRLAELGAKPSLLNPIWYSCSLLLGALAGWAGDNWSLGFVAETERQVSQHLQNHLQQLPAQDSRTRLILQQMHEDESQHAQCAIKAGATPLPKFIQTMMTQVAKLMTKTSYFI